METTQTSQPAARLYACAQGVNETVERLKAALVRLDLTLFAEFDHEKNARDANLSLRPTRVLVFGSPAVGTHLMEACPAIAVDLPLRMAVWEDGVGQTWLTFPPVDETARQLGLGDNPIPGKMRLLLESLAAEVSAK